MAAISHKIYQDVFGLGRCGSLFICLIIPHSQHTEPYCMQIFSLNEHIS